MITSMRTVLSVVLITGLAAACGRKDDNGTGSDDLSGDSSVAREVVQSNVQDSLDALGEESGSASLRLNDDGLDLVASISRQCASEGSSAKVTINSDFAKEISISNKLRSFKRSLSGKGEQVRVWSRSGGIVECAANGKVASIDWKNVDGLSLQLSFSRSRSATETISNLKKGTSVTRSASFDASGTRLISWVQAPASDDSVSVIRDKTITSSVVRSFTANKANGETKDLKLTTEVLSSAPLKVTVTRALADLALQSKVINSGTIIATNKDGGKVESTFSALKINFKDGNCTPESGSIVSKFYAKGATSPSKTLTTTFDSGVGATVDESNSEVATIEINGCDPED